MKKFLFLFVIMLSVGMLLTACGSSKTGSGDTDDTKKGTETKSALEEIKETGVINVGIEGAYPPFNYFNDKNELIGFDVDITNEITKRMGIEPNFIATPWDTIIGGLVTNKYDIILSSMAITDERKKKVDFSDVYYRTGVQVFVAKDDDSIKDPKTDLKGKKVGVATGTTFAEEARELGAEAVEYKTDQLTFQDLANGRIDAVITNQAVGSWLVKTHDHPIKRAGDLLYVEIAGITINKGQEDLVEEINKHLTDMMEDGTYEEISMKWFGMNINEE